MTALSKMATARERIIEAETLLNSVRPSELEVEGYAHKPSQAIELHKRIAAHCAALRIVREHLHAEFFS